MSELSSLSKRSVHILKNDQQALNAAYQVADEALVNRNIRDQQRILPYEAIEHLSQKGLGGIRIPKRYGGAFVSNKTLAQVFRILSKADSNVGQIPQNQISLLNLIDLMGNEEQKNVYLAKYWQVNASPTAGLSARVKTVKPFIRRSYKMEKFGS